jgi:hypothetical protein
MINGAPADIEGFLPILIEATDLIDKILAFRNEKYNIH